MEVNEALYEREAEAEPTMAAVERAVRLGERLEQAEQHLRIDADAGVPHAHLSEALNDVARKTDRACGLRELHGILQQVADHLGQASRVALDPHRTRCGRDVQSHSGRCEQGAVILGRTADDVPEIDALVLDLELTSRNSRHLQEVVDEPREVTDLAHRDLQGALRFRSAGGARSRM